jgi:hypothetical protein
MFPTEQTYELSPRMNLSDFDDYVVRRSAQEPCVGMPLVPESRETQSLHC